MSRLPLMLMLCLPIWANAASTVEVQENLDELANTDWRVRLAAAQELAELRPNDKASIAAIATALGDDDSRVRRAAADALGEIGSPASRAIPQLLALFDDKDATVIAAAARAVGSIGSRASRDVDALAKLMQHEDARVREASTQAIAGTGRRASKRVAQLTGKLDDPSPEVRVAAANVLGDIGGRASGASTKLVRMLDDNDELVRAAAQRALVNIGKPAVAPLISSIGSGDPVFSAGIVETLVRIGPDAQPALIKTLGDSKKPVLARRYSAMALSRMAEGEDDVLEALVGRLADDIGDIRASAAEALADVGLPAVEAIPVLVSMSADQEEIPLVRERALIALAKISPDDDVVHAALVAAVGDSNPLIYEAAVAALVRIRFGAGDDATEQTTALVARLKQGDDMSRIAAARKLGELGPYAKTAVPDLIDVLADPDNAAPVRAAAAGVLGLVGSDAEDAVPELIRAMDDEDSQLRDAALIALDRIGPQQNTLPALMQTMRTGDLATRASAAEAVRRFAGARLDAWRPLLHQSDAPVLRNWLSRHDELYGLEVDDYLSSGSLNPDAPSFFDVLGGRAAIRESMQLELIDNPVAGLSEDRRIALGTIASLDLESHPFDKMLKESDRAPIRLRLAEFAPKDRFFAYFRNLSALRNVFEGGADQFLRFESALTSKSVQYQLQMRYLERLGLNAQLLERLDAMNAVRDLAIVAPDLFFVDGTDLTAIANLTSPSITQSVLELLDLEKSGLHWAISGEVLAISTSRAELEQVQELQRENGEGSLGQSDEFLYMQQQISVENTTQAYFYFSDAFIRRLVSPEIKIGQLRRMEARAEMELMVSAALLYLLDGHRKIPSKQQLVSNKYLPGYFTDRDYILQADLTVTSAQFGALANLKPISANPVTRATEREASAYNEFADGYRQYWQQFFDPIAMRLDRIDNDLLELQTFILPLLDSALYDQVKEALTTRETGRALDVPVLQPAPAMMLSTNLSDDMRVKLSKLLADVLVEFASVDPEIFDSIGSGLHLAVQDSTPIVALGSGDVWGAVSKEMVRMQGFDAFLPFLLSLVSQPTTVLIELADTEKVHNFLVDAVARRAELGGAGEFHQLQNLEAWIYSLDIAGMFTAHLRIEIKNDYLLISNLPWSTQVEIESVEPMMLNGAYMVLNLAGMEKQLPALHTKVYTDYRATAVDGMGYLYPLLETGVADSVAEAVIRHQEVFGFSPVHPGSGEWRWRGSFIESSEFGTAVRPVQPEFNPGDKEFGVFPSLDNLSLNMQLEDEGLRAIVRWRSGGTVTSETESRKDAP